MTFKYLPSFNICVIRATMHSTVKCRKDKVYYVKYFAYSCGFLCTGFVYRFKMASSSSVFYYYTARSNTFRLQNRSELEIENPKWSANGGLHDALNWEENVCCSAPPIYIIPVQLSACVSVSHSLLEWLTVIVVVGGRIWTNFKLKRKLLY